MAMVMDVEPHSYYQSREKDKKKGLQSYSLKKKAHRAINNTKQK